MNKKLVLTVCALLAFSAANAVVTVKQGDKIIRYADNAAVTVDGSADAEVDYNGVRVFVPKGSRVVLSPAANDSVMITGHVQGVQVYGLALISAGRSSIVVNPASQTIAVRMGTVQVQNQVTGQTTRVSDGQMIAATNTAQTTPSQSATATPAASKTETAKPSETAKADSTASDTAATDTSSIDVANDGFTTVDSFVANDFSNVNTQQAVQNVEEEETLSPSAPTK